MVDITAIRLIDLVPPSIRDDPEVQAAAAALEGELQAVTAAIPSVLLISRIDELPEDVIDLLAWQWHVDFYEPTLPLAKKRALVRQSIPWHRRKGTSGAVQEMVSTVFSAGVVTEWFEYGGQPYHFRVETEAVITDTTLYDRLVKVIDAAKNVRSWLESVTIRRTWSGTIFFGSAQHFGRTLTLYPVAFTMGAVSGPERFGGALHSGKILSLEVS